VLAADRALRKPTRIANDFLPASPGSFMLLALGMSIGFRALGYLLCNDPAAITGSRDWIYHAFWLPLHLLLARHAAIVFSRNVDNCLAFAVPARAQMLRARAASVTSGRAWLASLLLIVPFVFLDGMAAVGYVQDNFETQGRAGMLIPCIWLIEWLATAQIWLYVIGSIHFNSAVLADENLLGRHEEVLLAGEARAPLLCSVENALITAVYGLTTVGYVWYADGQMSDYLVMGLSTLLVLVCFCTALLQLKAVLRRSLDAAGVRYLEALDRLPRNAPGTEAPPIDYAAMKEAVGMVFERQFTKDARVQERLRGIKLATVLALPPGSPAVPPDIYSRAMLLIECELRFAEFGAGEVRSLAARALMPVLLVVGKSVGGLFGVH
jgi:hypothetical protein